ncbi:MAG TPA: hypothetical protein VGY66_11235, partial [Gemmataceae bacterium]|nr:hypothetical protein [Gemmataceae bacterium]
MSSSLCGASRGLGGGFSFTYLFAKNGNHFGKEDTMYDFSAEAVKKKAELFIESFNSEVDRWKRRRDQNVSVDDFVTY